MNQNLTDKLADIIEQLSESSNQQESPESKEIKLGHKALDLIEKLLAEDPTNTYPRFMRMKVHAWALENTQKVIEEAEYILAHAADDEDKVEACKWLAYLYEDKLAMPQKSIEIIQDFLIDLTQMFKTKKYRRDEISGYMLNMMAYILQNMGKTEEALNTWVKSFEAYPDIHNRNGEAGLKLLEAERLDEAEKMVEPYMDWSHNDDELVTPIGEKLKQLLDAKKLAKNPNLIALYFRIVRNYKAEFNVKDDADFHNRFLPPLLEYAQYYKTNSYLWITVAGTYEYSKDYQKAYHAQLEVYKGDDPNRVNNIMTDWDTCKKTKKDFFSLPFKFVGSSIILYNCVTECEELYNDLGDIRFAELGLKFGEVAYQQYSDYLYHGKGSTQNNQPHIFAMLCNNYGDLLEYVAATKQGEEKTAMMQLAANIHWQGYQMSPFRENIKNAIAPAFYGELYEDCIKYADIYLNEYADEEEDENDILKRKRIRHLAVLEIESRQNEDAKETIEIPKIFSDSSFHDEASWQAQLANYKKLFEIISPDFNNIEYAEETKNQLVFEWSGYSITLMTERERSDQTADCIIVKHSEGAFAFQYIHVEKSKGFFSFKKEPFEQFKIDIISNINKDYTYQFGVETTLLNQLNMIWKEILSRAEIGQYYLQKFNAEITKEKILSFLELPVVKEKFDDYWNPKKSGFWSGDRYLLFRQHGAQYKKEECSGILAIGIGNEGLGDSFDLRKFLFYINQLENPTGVILKYQSSQNNRTDDRYNDDPLYISSFDWELYREALEEFQNYTPLIIFENENYVADINES